MPQKASGSKEDAISIQQRLAEALHASNNRSNVATVHQQLTVADNQNRHKAAASRARQHSLSHASPKTDHRELPVTQPLGGVRLAKPSITD